MTDLKSFLSNPTVACAEASVLAVVMPDQPLLFMNRVRLFLSAACDVPVARVDVTLSDEAAARRQLETSFLGQRYLYVLSGTEHVSDKVRGRWRDYLSSYAGPHIVLLHAPDGLKQSSQVCLVEVPERVSASDVVWLLPLWPAGERERLGQFLALMLQRTGPVGVEQLCLLSQYAGVLGSGAREFMHEWIELIVRPDQSLFDVSSRLFAGDMQRFLIQWARIRDEYPATFWTAYWSEQFFRAYWFVRTKRAGDIDAVRKISARLPFSFINRDWRLHQADHLAWAQVKAFELDVHIKTGGDEHALMSLLLPFLSMSAR